jgi:hypothetical protein
VTESPADHRIEVRPAERILVKDVSAHSPAVVRLVMDYPAWWIGEADRPMCR